MRRTPTAHSKTSPRQAIIARFRKDKRGVAAIEFAMVGVPFFIFIAAILELSLQMTSSFLLDRGTERVARLVLTGQLQNRMVEDVKKPPTKEEFRQELCDEVSVFLDCDKLFFDLRTYEEFSKVDLTTPMKDGVVDRSGFQYSLGKGDKISVLRTYYEWPFSFQYLKAIAGEEAQTMTLSSIAAFRNEPF